jgi:hypothetical protein
MLTITIEKPVKGTIIQLTSADTNMLRRVYRHFLRASLRHDQCTRTTYQGAVRSGEYSYVIYCPGLDYNLACDRVAELWPEGERSYPLPLIGG